MILACNDISKSFGTNQILDHVSFHVNDREKVAVIGMNGCGKSTLFKIIVGDLQADEGDVIFAKGSTFGYLSQYQGLSSDCTIYEEMLSVKEAIIKLNDEIRALEIRMKSLEGKELEQALSTYTRLTHEFEIQNGYAYKSEVVGVLKGLGFSEEDFEKKISTLSGGQKTRIALGKLLLTKPDLILLDEPTNHLDLISIAWLETFLQNYPGAVLIIAHDRYFLDKVVTKVVEIEHNKSQVFEGNYTSYAEKKANLTNALLKQYYNQQREMKHQEEVIAKLRSFNREKSIKRAESREKMLNKIDVIEKPITETHTMRLSLEPRVISGNDVLTVEGLEKSFGENKLFSDLSFDIKRGEKVAIIGNNGTGKTTILKIINDQLAADAGTIRLGSKVQIGYYDQEQKNLDENKTIFEEMSDAYPTLDNTTIRNVLAAFLFKEDDVFKKQRDLSGGERGRVSLAKLMLSEANLIILDEPTNHLDILSKEILEGAINSYTGTVLYVSHDRYFINKTATRIMDLTGKQLINYVGNYDYYMEKKEETEERLLVTKTPLSSSNSTDTTNSDNGENKLSWQQQKEEQAKQRKRKNDLKKTEDSISEVETRIAEIDDLLTKEEIYTNVPRLMELNQEKKEKEQKLEELMELWEELADEDE